MTYTLTVPRGFSPSSCSFEVQILADWGAGVGAWAEHVGISLGQSALLALALWSWAAFCACALAKAMSGRQYISASWHAVFLSGCSSAILVIAESVELYFNPRAALLGIHYLFVRPPFTWWLWVSVLICELLVSAAKISAYRTLLQDEASRQGVPVQVKPRWVTLIDLFTDVLSDGTNYVWHFRS